MQVEVALEGRTSMLWFLAKERRMKFRPDVDHLGLRIVVFSAEMFAQLNSDPDVVWGMMTGSMESKGTEDLPTEMLEFIAESGHIAMGTATRVLQIIKSGKPHALSTDEIFKGMARFSALGNPETPSFAEYRLQDMAYARELLHILKKY